jgi:hypothetical protein
MSSSKQQHQQRLFALCICLLVSLIQVSAWSTGSQNEPFVRAGSMTSHRKQPATTSIYAPISSTSTSTSTSPIAAAFSCKTKPSNTAQKMLKDTTAFSSSSSRAAASKIKLSHSVLASCDYPLPSCPTAHGILSPETVMRMDEVTRHHRSEALVNFLETYRRDGPMSCLPMLSDPQVLPHLTNAMRDIVA